MRRAKAEFHEVRLPAIEALVGSAVAGYVIRMGGVDVEVPRGFDARELLELLCVLREVVELETCRRLGINDREYLEDLLPKLGG